MRQKQAPQRFRRSFITSVVSAKCKSKIDQSSLHFTGTCRPNRTPFYIIHNIQPITITRHVHAMLLTLCFSHPRLAGGEQGRHRPDWHVDGER